jgi:RNA polymerase sigma-70 factor (ECF subfamily)
MPDSPSDVRPASPSPTDPAALWCAHRGWLAAVVLAHMPREAELEDLLQDVAVAITTGATAGRLPRDEAAVPAWLRSVALNVARTAMRRAYRARRRPPPAADPATPFDAPPGDELDRLRDLVAQLREHAREPLLLQVVHGLTVGEIARVMDLPERTVETRLVRARRGLREAMGPHTEPETIPRTEP